MNKLTAYSDSTDALTLHIINLLTGDHNMATETDNKTGYNTLSMEDAAELQTLIEVYRNAAAELRVKLLMLYPEAKAIETKPQLKVIRDWMESQAPSAKECRPEVKQTVFGLAFTAIATTRIVTAMEAIQNNTSGDSIDFDKL